MSPLAAQALPAVLFVDDEQNILNSIRRLVRDLPIRPLFATSGHEALAMVASECPRLVISDYRMGGLDGLELISRIRAGFPQVRCALHTADPPPGARGLGLRVIGKPCDPEAFRSFVVEAAEGASSPSP
ncbi:MAG: response regulator [Myxococcales bacterium]|nr:response regulator [Myxococcales bacterium]